MGSKLGGRATVIGRGMGGLFAAAAVAPHFDEVVILDRDREPAGAAPRKGVPQGYHFHILMPGGMDAMSEWFPGFPEELVAAGAIPLTGGRDFYAYTPEGKSYSLTRFQPEPIDGERMYVQTRPLLEHCVRRRVLAMENVSLRSGVLVDGPLLEGDRVTGVTTRDGGTVPADLVVDASGRNSCTARWLVPMGFTPATEERIGCDVHYVSTMVEPEDWDAFEGVVFFVVPTRDGPYGARFAAAIKLEGGRWMLMIGTRHADTCPTDWDGMVEFGRTLPSPAWSQCAERARPVEPIMSYRLPTAIRRRYDQLDRFPDGLLPVADSVCFYNPTYGQGMSAAAGQCRGLRSILAARAAGDRGLDGLAAEFFPIANDWVRGPWAMAAMGDLEYRDCTGDFPAEEIGDLQRFGEIVAASKECPELWSVVLDITSLRRPLSAVNEVQLG